MKHIVESPADRKAARGGGRVEGACGQAPKGGLLAGVDSTQGAEEACGRSQHDEVVNVKEELLHVGLALNMNGSVSWTLNRALDLPGRHCTR